MIKIQKDGTTIICSNNTYQSMYKRLGYEIVGQSKEKVQEFAHKLVEEAKEKDLIKTIEEVDEIPVVEVENTKVSKKNKK